MGRTRTVAMLVLWGGLMVAAPPGAASAQGSNGSSRGVPAHSVEKPCEFCHEMTAGTSHPTGVRPSMPIPSDLPLDAGGRVGCVTCHDVTMASAATQATSPFMLRRSVQGGALCAACHGGKRTNETRLSHALMIASAHGGGDLGGFNQARAGVYPADSRSMQCMGCHDGSIAASDNMSFAGLAGSGGQGSPGGDPGLGLTHPVGTDYANAAMTHRELEPVGGLQRGAVRLVEGKVGCTSCHSPFSKHAKLLVMRNDGSQLCLRCHHV